MNRKAHPCCLCALKVNVRRLEDLHADDVERLDEWGFSMPPSERRRRQERIDALALELTRARDDLAATFEEYAAECRPGGDPVVTRMDAA